MNFWKQICFVLSEQMSFKVFLPYGPLLTKTKKIVKKSKVQNFEKEKKKMVWGYGEKVPFHQMWH